jgi:hypothetical protein
MLGRRSRKLGHPRPAKVPEAIRERKALSSVERGAGDAPGVEMGLGDAARAGLADNNEPTTANAISQRVTMDESLSFTREMLYYTRLSSNPSTELLIGPTSQTIYIDYYRELPAGPPSATRMVTAPL